MPDYRQRPRRVHRSYLYFARQPPARIYEGIEPGGQLTTTTDVENFPGYPDGVSGQQMMADMRRQAERFGADIRIGTVTSADLSSRPFHVVIDGTTQIEGRDAHHSATGRQSAKIPRP